MASMPATRIVSSVPAGSMFLAPGYELTDKEQLPWQAGSSILSVEHKMVNWARRTVNSTLAHQLPRCGVGCQPVPHLWGEKGLETTCGLKFCFSWGFFRLMEVIVVGFFQYRWIQVIHLMCCKFLPPHCKDRFFQMYENLFFLPLQAWINAVDSFYGQLVALLKKIVTYLHRNVVRLSMTTIT